MKEDALCEFYYCDLAESPMGEWVVPQGGSMRIPDGPGLGVDIDEDVIARRRMK